MQKGIENSPDLPVPAAGGGGVWISALIVFICSLLLAVLSLVLCRLSLVEARGATPQLRCAGFSLWWLQGTGSRCEGFSSCGSRGFKLGLSGRGTQA